MASRVLLFIPAKNSTLRCFFIFHQVQESLGIDHTPWKTKMIRGSYFQISLPIKLSTCKLNFNFTWQKILWDLAYVTTKFMILSLLLSFPMLEHASLLFVLITVFVEYRRIILLSFYSAFIGFGILIFFRGLGRDFATAFFVCMRVNIWKVECFTKFYHVQFTLV